MFFVAGAVWFRQMIASPARGVRYTPAEKGGPDVDTAWEMTFHIQLRSYLTQNWLF